jgi:ADP-dependent NAD(P)H-hydrate dehydratase / NAD(P)H-hydrate epimerase
VKVVSSKQMSHIEMQAYRDGASESDFMEEAGSGVALVVNDYAEKHDLDRVVILLCGRGNNAGDAYVAGIHLLHLDYEVFALQVAPIAESSPLCKQNYNRFMTEGGRSSEALIEFPFNGIIVDGLFGTGFHGKVEEPYAAIIELANNSNLPIIAIDIPSGLNGETGQVEGVAIIATETAFLGLPKTGFFLNDGWNHVGKLRYVDFGLPQEYIEDIEADLIMLSQDMLKPLFPPIKRNRHKYEAGHVIGLAGSPGMPGAAILATTAAYRGGAGIVRLLHPDGMQAELATSLPELIKVPYNPEQPQEIIDLMNRASATFVGPGLGRTPSVRKLLHAVLPKLNKPCVIDADALTILAEEEIAIPNQTIFTPQHGEMTRLLKLSSPPAITQEFLSTCRAYAETHGVTLVRKGGPTFIFHTGLPIMVNPTGDPGMATAGSGDVLTGLLAALLAQGMLPHHAAALGVFLHGVAGEHAAEEMTSRGVIASDIIYRFPEAFKFQFI